MAASVSRVKIMDARSKGWVNTWVERTHNCRGMTDTTQHSPNLNWHTLVVEFRSLGDWLIDFTATGKEPEAKLEMKKYDLISAHYYSRYFPCSWCTQCHVLGWKAEKMRQPELTEGRNARFPVPEHFHFVLKSGSPSELFVSSASFQVP